MESGVRGGGDRELEESESSCWSMGGDDGG